MSNPQEQEGTKGPKEQDMVLVMNAAGRAKQARQADETNDRSTPFNRSGNGGVTNDWAHKKRRQQTTAPGWTDYAVKGRLSVPKMVEW